MNESVYLFIVMLKFVVMSAAEAELGSLFLNSKEWNILLILLQKLGHKQPPMPIHCDSVTATGIENNTIKKQRSHSIEMCFFWITNQDILGEFDVKWHPGQKK